MGYHRSNCTVDSCTKFNHTNFWTEYFVLYTTLKKRNPMGIYPGSEDAKGLVRPAQSICFEKLYSGAFTVRLSAEGHHLERKRLVEGMPSARLD
jgi:hypothetical protein